MREDSPEILYDVRLTKNDWNVFNFLLYECHAIPPSVVIHTKKKKYDNHYYYFYNFSIDYMR